MRANNCYACGERMKGVEVYNSILNPRRKVRPYFYLRCTKCPIRSLSGFIKMGEEMLLARSLVIRHWNDNKQFYLLSWVGMKWL